MNFDLTEEQASVAEIARRFAETELAPVAARLDLGADKEADRAIFLKNLQGLANLGFMGMNVDAEYGGSEVGVVAFSVAITEIARACASTAVTMSVTNMVGEVIQAIGNQQQKRDYLPRLCSGEYPAGGFCLSEAGAGSDPSGMKTRAVRDGDDWVIDGTKMWISSAEYAGVFVVWAVTDPDAPRGRGISCFLVEGDTPGITVAKAEHKMGQCASATNQVIFDQCRVPGTALMGQLNDGFRIAVAELAGGRIGIGSLALGVGLAAMDYARQYASEREQFGTSIASMQGPQWMMADAYTQLEASRLLVLFAAFNKENQRPFSKQASMAKLHASETANQVCYTAIQLAGGIGYTREVPLERYARDARVTSIYEGTSEIQRVIIARELLAEIA
ncbi:acyl-CoA dehydrogenase [Seongchinamella unica]|uniref:3-sulfinopropanoyl-CoA desulfinase n=1 Tax=Seongchinamella unica TaxID=2547392 RepID=A0A4V2ZX65_9GAMM|nr:acyl-CoA dehydrogenase family protein [Seongchinamella unica]TDG13434.1 acyl-CoA dehydrogenase [Seongchinamella unica]